MNTLARTALVSLSLLALVPSAARAGTRDGYGLSVLVDGAPRPEYAGRGTVYVEAVHGRNYVLRVTNPTPWRVAVALSVDGLNSIDAKHTEARDARKWVLEPYGSADIEGWQVSDRAARKFFFTTERSSYGALLGKTDNLGVIEAVFFREKAAVWRRPYGTMQDRKDRFEEPMDRDASPGAAGSGAAPPERQAAEKSAAMAPKPQSQPKLSDDYAATGMGDRTRHDVTQVALELEDAPVAAIRLRYEFRPQLVKLGVLPRWEERPLARRERATGFGDSWAPEPDIR